MNLPFLCDNIPTQPAYGIYISQLGRLCGDYDSFCERNRTITSKLINPRRACAARVNNCVCVCVCVSVCLSVCLSVRTYSCTTRNKAAEKRYQQVQCQQLCFKSYGMKRSVKANVLMSTASPRPVFAALHTSEVTQRSSRESKAAT